MYNFKINSIYSFETFSPTLLGQRHQGARLKGMTDYKTALTYENVEVKHNQVKADLPAGAPDKASDNTYLLFETSAGTTMVLAMAWINETSITEDNYRDTKITVHNTMPEDAMKIKQVLGAAGYNMVTFG